MPRKLNPGDIKVGKGLAPAGTVEDNSHRYPERDVDPLRVHLHDPSRAHMASSIGIVDAANCFISDEVEGALQELCSGAASAGRLNGLIAGGTFVEPIPTVGVLILTLVPNTFIMDGGMLFNASGLTITLPDVAQDCFVYFDEDSTSGTYQTLQFSIGGPPEVETTAGVENVMIAKITCDGAGNISAYQDARFFVRNLDRKVEYSSRQGEDVDAWSEGCFATLNAAMFWMQWYGPTTSSEEQKGTILVRGHHTLTDTLTVPTDYVTFQGDGDAALILAANSGRPLVDISGRSGIHFKDLALISQTPNNASLVGVLANTTAVSDIVFEQCRFSASDIANRWTRAISLDTAGGAQCERIRVINCHIRDAESGILIDSSSGGLISGCQITAGFGAATSVYGIGFSKNAGFGVENNSVVGTVIEGFIIGIFCEEATKFKVEGCFITEATHGISILANTSSYANISNTYVELEDSTGLNGISLQGSYHSVDNCDIWNWRTNGSYGVGVIPVGVSFNGIHCKVQNTKVRNFLNTQTPAASVGHAVEWDGSASHGLVSDCILQDSGIDLPNGASAMVITGNKITGCGDIAGGVTQPALISVGYAAAVGVSVTGNLCDCLATAAYGIRFLGDDGLYGHNILIDSNTIIAPNGASSAGIHITKRYRDWTISNNKVDGFISTAPTDPVATGILLDGASAQLPSSGAIQGNSIVRCAQGIICQGDNAANAVTGALAEIQITDNKISYCCRASAWPLFDTFFAVGGSMGIGVEFCRAIMIEGNQIHQMGVINDASGAISIPGGGASNEMASGIYVRNSTSVGVDNNQIGPVYCNSTGPAILFAQPIRIDCRTTGLVAGSTFTMDVISVDGNTITGGGATPPHGTGGTNCGIFVGSDNGTDDPTNVNQIQGLSICGNQITNIANPLSFGGNPTAGIAVQQGRIGTTGGLGTTSEVQINDNIIRGVVGVGIQVFGAAISNVGATLNAVSVSSNMLEDITHASESVAGIQLRSREGCRITSAAITENTISVVNDAAIQAYCGVTASGGITSVIQEVRISENRVLGVTAGVSTASVGVWAEVDGPDGTLANIRISENSLGTIVGGVANVVEGVRIDHALTDIVAYEVSNNTIKAVTAGVRILGSTPSSGFSTGSMREVFIDNNTMVVVDAAAASHFGIYLLTEGYALDLCSFSDNTIAMLGAFATQPGISLIPLYTTTDANAYVHKHVRVEGNTITHQVRTGNSISVTMLGNASVDTWSLDRNTCSAIMLFQLSNSPAVGDLEHIRSLSFSDNHLDVSISGIMLTVASITNVTCDVDGIAFSNNILTGDFSTSLSGITVSMSSGEYEARNVVVSNNQIAGCSRGLSLQSLGPGMEGWVICDNAVSDWGFDSNLSAISLATQSYVQNAVIRGNTITQGTDDAWGSAIHYASVGERPTLGLTIAENSVYQCGGSGALVELGAATNASPTINPSDRAIAVRDNTFTRCALFNNANVDAVVLIKPDATNTDPGAIVGFTVSGNTLNLCGPAGPAHIPWVRVDVNDYNISYLGDVSGNSLVGDTADVGTDVHWPDSGIYLTLPETTAADGGYALTVNDNTVHRFASYGIRCVFDGVTRGVQISGNHTVRVPGDALTADPVHIGVSVDQDSLLGLSVENNVCDGDAVFGIDVRQIGVNAGTDVFPWQGINVSNNVIRRIKSLGGSGINIQAKDASIEGLTVDSNQISGPGYRGIEVENNSTPAGCVNANLEAVSISGNTISMLIQRGLLDLLFPLWMEFTSVGGVAYTRKLMVFRFLTTISFTLIHPTQM